MVESPLALPASRRFTVSGSSSGPVRLSTTSPSLGPYSVASRSGMSIVTTGTASSSLILIVICSLTLSERFRAYVGAALSLITTVSLGSTMKSSIGSTGSDAYFFPAGIVSTPDRPM